MVITSARNDIFSLDQKHLIDIGILYYKQPKSRFLKIFHKDPPAPLTRNLLLQRERNRFVSVIKFIT